MDGGVGERSWTWLSWTWRLQWQPGSVRLMLRSRVVRRVTIGHDGLKEMTMAGGNAKLVGDIAGNGRMVELPAGDEVTLEI